MKNAINIIFALTALIAVFLVWQRLGWYLEIKDQEVKNQAVQGCMEVSSYTYTNQKDGVTTIEPIETSFEKCLMLKGY